MSLEKSYRDKTFLVVDPDARVRNDDFLSFATYKAGDQMPADAKAGDFKKIPPNTKITIDEVKIVQTGAAANRIFALALSEDRSATLGWTSTRNLKGRFVNETLGLIKPEAGASRFGPNAAWSGGNFLEQLDLVSVVDARLDVERLAMKTIHKYFDMVESAAQSGVIVAINSGFRSYTEQKFLFEGFKKKLPGFNTAAPPGRSNHQNGIAFDIDVAGGAGNPTYDWLTKNATSFGFVRTVNKEPWHWEYDPPKAQKAKSKGTFKTANVSV